MKISPNLEEVELAADLLVNRYNVSAQVLGQLFGTKDRDQANDVLKHLGGQKLDRLKIAKLHILRKGATLFGGSDQKVKDLRQRLLKKLPEHEIKVLFEKHGSTAANNITSTSHMPKPLADKKWHADGNWPKDFVKATGFPIIFSGVKQHNTSETVVEVHPKIRVPQLADFQKHLKEEMLTVLDKENSKTRCIVTLPTGGGKTRVAVEAFIDWMIPRFADGQYLVWIAQSEELCEQAIKCVEQMWSDREFTTSLFIYRFFSGRDIPGDKLGRGGVVVSSIQQLHSRIKNDDQSLNEILEKTGAMIIDEAHRAVSSMYDNLLRKAESLRGPDLFPICGLTATPGRTGLHGMHETTKLVNRFEAYLVSPKLGPDYETDPLRYFREHGFLARANHITYRSGIEYTLTDKELEEVKPDSDESLPPGFLKRLASDKKRNMLIIKRLLKIRPGTPTIIYACTVDHAYFLSVILTEKGRPSGTISSDTPLTIRRGLIKDFKEGKIDFLCNFGVLATGFDAPTTRCIAMCRPTTSDILYEQIIGRGLRGPNFGGTKECIIIDFADNIKRLGKSLSYARFSDSWSTDNDEKSEY